MDKKQARQLSAVDWDFVFSTDDAASGVHWYPGTFVPDLPGVLIEALTEPGDLVLDPYGGVGTTGLSALIRGRRAVCCDANPVAILSSYVGNVLLSLRFAHNSVYEDVFRSVFEIVDAGSADQRAMNFEALTTRDIDARADEICDRPAEAIYSDLSIRPARIDELAPWYGAKTLQSLAGLAARIRARDGSKFVQLMSFAMISAVCRQLSSQTRSWGHIADNVLPTELIEKDVKRACTNWLRRTKSRLDSLSLLAPLATSMPIFSARSINWSYPSEDVSQEAPKGVRMLVTSPPYAGAIDYILAQRLSFYLFGSDAAELSVLASREMGARRKRFNRTHVDVWASELAAALERQLLWVDPSKGPNYAAFVMPHKDAGRDQGEVGVKRALRDKGWSLEFERDRSIRQARARQSWTSIKRETILIFQK